MGSRLVRIIAGLCVAGMATTAAAQPGESSNRVAGEKAWNVFVDEGSDSDCWTWNVAAPEKTVNTRDGRVANVRRGDIMLFVVYRPNEGINGQVSFTGGYPFAEDSPAILDIDGTVFELFTEGEWAWSANEGEDQKIIAAMKSGTKAVITALSNRGTQTKDTFSLLGFTATNDAAEKRCAKKAE